jgi:hypothetical protein
VVDTNTGGPEKGADGPRLELKVGAMSSTLYATDQEALKAVRDDYLY